MDNQLKRITAVLCTIFLLSGCHSDIQQTQAKEDTTLQQETQEVSLQLQDEPLITEEFEGTLTFADTGDLQEEQKELINLYMKWYYDSLAKEEVEQLPDIFVSGEQAQIKLETEILDYQLLVRSSQKSDLSLTGYQSVFSVEEMEEEENGDITVRLSEDSTQNFAQFEQVDSITTDIIHIFRFRKTDDGWKIYHHVNYNDRLYWTVTGDHRQYMNGELSQETVLANISEGIEEKKALLEQNIQRRDQAGADKEETAVKISYDSQAAVEYAQTWALDRNEEWADYSMNGGNCQNFVSQCLLAGGIPMDTQGESVWKWYGDTPNNLPNMQGRSASWSGVDEFLNYARENEGSGLAAIVDASYDTGEVGDVLIVGYGEEELYHAVMITDVVTDEDGNVIDYLVCSNTANQKDYPISAYGYTYQVLIKILGSN